MSKHAGAELAQGRVSASEVLGHTVANITPSAMAAFTVALVVADAGVHTWLVYALVGVFMGLVAFQVAAVTRLAPAAGSLFVSLSRVLHPLAGVLAGWCMIGGYLGALFAAPVLVGSFTHKVLLLWGLPSPPAWVLAAICAVVSWWLALRDVEIATRFGLIVEVVSIGAMLAVGVFALVRHGWVDPRQLQLTGLHVQGLLTAGTLTVLAYGGFETAANLSRETQDPARVAPRAMLWSVGLVGLFFVFMAYAVVAGFSDNTAELGKTSGPLGVLAVRLHLPVLATLADLGMATAAFSATVATLNSIARLLFSMARHRLMPSVLGRIHPRFATPAPALHLLGAASLLFAVVSGLAVWPVLKIIDLFGIFTSLGFLVIYLLALAARPVYCRRHHLKVPWSAWIALLLSGPMLGRVLWANIYPVPPFPKDWVTVAFAAYLLLGVIVYRRWARGRPERVEQLISGIAGD